VVDGRVLALNFMEVIEGRGVNANVEDAASVSRGANHWVLRRCDGSDGDDCGLPVAGKWQPRVEGGEGRKLGVDGSIVTVRCTKDRDHCIGWTGGRVCVVHLKSRDAACVQWRVVGTDRLQHVESGKFLTTNTKYVHIENIDHIWEGNHSDLELQEEKDEGDWSQRWVLGHANDPKDTPDILRHYGDGRAVDVHGWHFSDGGNMGTEHSAHSECRGVQYEICPWQQSPEA